MTGVLNHLSPLEWKVKEAQKLHITDLPDDMLKLIFFQVYDLQSLAWIGRVSRGFQSHKIQALIWSPFEEFFKL